MKSLIVLAIPIIIVSILIFMGLIFLQVFMSKKANRWPGIVLPACSIMFALIAALSSRSLFIWGSGFDQAIVSLIMFALGNIPTLIYIFIYFVCHAKRVSVNEGIPLNRSLPLSNNQEIIKMNIQDL